MPPSLRRPACVHCGRSFQPLFPGAACCSDECVDAEKARRGLDRHGAPCKPPAARSTWRALCPPRYAAFDLARLPARGKAIAAAVLAWQPAHTPGRGLAIVGESDCGKSMLLHEVARRAWVSGWDVHCTLSTEFAWHMGDLQQRQPFLQRCLDCALLLLDDIGKARLTDRVETDLYHLLEHRERWQKPILWSANLKGAHLAATMSEDRAAPIVNRLRRSAEVFSV